MINSSLFVTLLEKRKRIKQIGGAQRNPYISKHLETKMSFRIEKQPLLYDPEKEISKLTKPQGQLRKLRGYQPNSQNTTHPHFFFNFFFSLSLSLGGVYIQWQRLRGLQLLQPHIFLLSLTKINLKKPQKKNWPSFYLPSSPMFSFLSLLVSCQFQRACVQIT